VAKMDDESKPGEVEAAESPEAVEPAAAPTVAAGDAEGVPAAPPEELELEGAAPTESDDVEEPLALPPQEVRAILEALIFASPQPIGPREIGRVLGGAPQEEWLPALEEIRADYSKEARGLQLVEVAGGFQITTRPEYNDWVRELLDPKTPTRLSIQALETLAVIAYRQPVTLPEVIELRGVRSGGVVKTLLEKRLIRILGRKDVVGRPMLYGTTKQFLLHFGLRDLSELPDIEEFADVLGEEVDVAGLKRAIEAPQPAEVPLAEEGSLADAGGAEAEADVDPREG